jgi:peptidoglycan hydrolase FlgJ
MDVRPLDAPAPGSGPVGPPRAAEIRQAAQEFESLVLQQMLRTMRQASSLGGGFLQGSGERVYRDLMDEELARVLARGGGLGLADMLARDLMQREAAVKKTSSSPSVGPMSRLDEGGTPEGDAR